MVNTLLVLLIAKSSLEELGPADALGVGLLYEYLLLNFVEVVTYHLLVVGFKQDAEEARLNLYEDCINLLLELKNIILRMHSHPLAFDLFLAKDK